MPTPPKAAADNGWARQRGAPCRLHGLWGGFSTPSLASLAVAGRVTLHRP